MMALYLISALALAAVTAAILTLSLRQRAGAAPGRQAAAVYRDQLKELDQDVAAGKLPEAEAQTIRAEIARRLLAESPQTDTAAPLQARPLLPVLLALIIPAVAVPIYLANGAPSLPDTPLSARLNQAIENNDIAAMIAKVEEHLGKNPSDVQGWQILASVYTETGRHADAASAYETLLRLETPTADRLVGLGEVLTFANQGMVTARAAKLFDAAIALDAKHPKANYYAALAIKQEGKADEARKRFEALLKDSPSDAPWRKFVEAELTSLAKAPALTPEQMKAGEAMSGDDQQAMIRGMVDGLEAKLQENGNDVSGWLRLIRARTVLGDNGKAREALGKATGLFQNKPQELASIKALAEELNLQ
jgi:cytochrome c-type biogenesis protein CcmH